KLEREMALRAEQARRRRRRQEIIGAAVAAVLVVGAVIWIVTALSGKPSKPSASANASASPSVSASASPTSCVWQPLVDPGATPTPRPKPSGAREVGKPPANEPRSGIQVMTITTSQGAIKIEMDDAKSPCIAASFTYLASKNFFNNTKCHR